MKPKLFAAIFITTHIIFIFLQLHKQTQFINESYRTQKNEKLYADLLKDKEQLEQQLQVLQSKEEIRRFAQTELNMAPVNLKQIRKVRRE